MTEIPMRAAFFDVDETLVTVKSMYRFLAFDLAARGLPASEYVRYEQELHALTADGVARQDVARAYFRLFAGREQEKLTRNGLAWFLAECRRGTLFHPTVLVALRRHAADGDLIVLVSGSFAPCLDPIAVSVDADVVLCSRPEIRGHRYTGEIALPMIGEAKAAAVRAQAATRGIDLTACFAYGDHSSDLPVLKSVGRPVIVGDDPTLACHAARHGWPQIPATGSAVRSDLYLPLLEAT